MKAKKMGIWEVDLPYGETFCEYAVFQRGTVRPICYTADKENANKIAKMLNKLAKFERAALKKKKK